MRHDHADGPAVLGIQAYAAGEEQPGYVLARGVPADERRFHRGSWSGLRRALRSVLTGLVAGETSRWVADNHVRFAAGQRDPGARGCGCSNRRYGRWPSMLQPFQRLDSFLQNPALARVGYAVVVERQHGVLPLLNVVGDVAHQRIERLGQVHQGQRVDQAPSFRSSSSTCIVTSRSANMFFLRNRICKASPRYSPARRPRPVTGVSRRLDGRSDRQYPHRAGEVHRDRVNGDPRHGEPQPLQRVLGVQRLLIGGLDEVRDRLGYERPRSAGRDEDGLVEWVELSPPAPSRSSASAACSTRRVDAARRAG